MSDSEEGSLSEHNFYSSSSDRSESRHHHSHHHRRRSDREKHEEPVEKEKSIILHIKGLTRNTNEDHLREIFSNYGLVKRVKVNKKDRTAISQGIGFVEMVEEEEAALAIDHLDGSQIDGVKVFVSQVFVSPFESTQKRNRSDRSRSRSHRRSRSHSRSRSNHYRRRSRSRSRHHRHHRNHSR